MADKIELGKHVTLAEHTTVLTHLNVGYRDHPLQQYFPSFTKPTVFGDGVFVGVNTTVLPGVKIGEGAFIGAASLVHSDVEPWTLVAGVPVKTIRKIRE
jgi:acetyltransferase-like isoleucine patch superfamily enzyme